MAAKETKRYLELQMEELKEVYGVTEEEKQASEEKLKKLEKQREKNAEIAKMYEDAAEYEEDLKGFEEELAIVKITPLKDIAVELRVKFPEEERDYADELNVILETGWKHFVEVENSHPQEQLELIKSTDFADVLEKLCEMYPAYEGDFESDIRELLIKRWENLVAIKKEHVSQELAEIKTTGLKPKYVKRVYEQYHGIKK